MSARLSTGASSRPGRQQPQPFTMTREEAERLQKEWQRHHAGDCHHPHSVLERTPDGYLTGCIRCLICGAEVSDARDRRGA